MAVSTDRRGLRGLCGYLGELRVFPGILGVFGISRVVWDDRGFGCSELLEAKSKIAIRMLPWILASALPRQVENGPRNHRTHHPFLYRFWLAAEPEVKCVISCIK